MDAVSEILVDRSRELGGLERMVATSVAAHVVFVAAVVLAPISWGDARQDEGPVMMISLGGAEGVVSGGLTSLTTRPVQSVPTEIKKTIDPVRPPAAAAPEMIEPLKNAPKKSDAKVDPAKDPKSRTPTKGAELQKGEAVADTRVRGQGFGLSTGGFGDGVQLSVNNFCCPEYIATMRDLIKKNWDSRQQSSGTTVMRFTIQRSGELTDIGVQQPSGFPALDFMATRALLNTRQLPPLPQAFTEPSLTVLLPFNYQR